MKSSPEGAISVFSLGKDLLTSPPPPPSFSLSDSCVVSCSALHAYCALGCGYEHREWRAISLFSILQYFRDIIVPILCRNALRWSLQSLASSTTRLWNAADAVS